MKYAHVFVVLFIIVLLRVFNVFTRFIYPYPLGLLHWHRDNRMIASMSVISNNSKPGLIKTKCYRYSGAMIYFVISSAILSQVVSTAQTYTQSVLTKNLVFACWWYGPVRWEDICRHISGQFRVSHMFSIYTLRITITPSQNISSENRDKYAIWIFITSKRRIKH